jgi:aerotaxis receptor
MQEALAAVQTVAVVLDDISHAANQQRQGIVQVSDVITHLDSVTQQNAAMVEQLSATADSMRAKSGAVNNSMRLFRLRAKDTSLAELGYSP